MLGALRFSFDDRRLFDQDERGFVLALAAQTAQTLQRTELYQAERRAAVNLQRALLPANIPRIPGWEVATHYSPAGDQEVGGDFYDVLEVSGGRYVAMVGDVMGRGLDAAASMAQVRSTVRAYAVEDPDPVAVFRRVDAFFASTRLDQLVTMVYLLIDPPEDTVQLASAGHLPPLLVGGAGARSVAMTPADPPFGVGRPDRHALALRLDRGDALVLITDGLVERRGEDIDEGIGRVLTAAAVIRRPRRRAARRESSRPPSIAVMTTTSRCWSSADSDEQRDLQHDLVRSAQPSASRGPDRQRPEGAGRRGRKAGPGAPVAIEATYGWYWAVDALQEAGFEVHLAHPKGLKALRRRKRVKTDPADADELVDLLRLGRFRRPTSPRCNYASCVSWSATAVELDLATYHPDEDDDPYGLTAWWEWA